MAWPLNRGDVIAAILRFGENDLLCYRAHQPPELVARQTRRLGPAAGLGAPAPWRAA